MLGEEKKAEVVYDHYKDTSAKLEYLRRLRDRLFLYILLVLALIFFGFFSNSGSENILSQFIVSKLGFTPSLDISFVGSLIWFGLLALVIRYFQTVIAIEKYYPYLHKLEEHIDHCCGGNIITREGKTYLGNYPWFLTWVHYLYTVVSPLLLLAVITAKISGEIFYQNPISAPTLFNFFVFLCLVVSILLYLRLVHHKK